MGVKALFCSCIFVATFGTLVVSLSNKTGTQKLAVKLVADGMVSEATKLPDKDVDELNLVTEETSTEGLYCTLLMKHNSTEKKVTVVGTRLDGGKVLKGMNDASFANVTHTRNTDAAPNASEIVDVVDYFVTNILNTTCVGPTFGIKNKKGSGKVAVGVNATTVCLEKTSGSKANSSLGIHLRLDIVVKKLNV